MWSCRKPPTWNATIRCCRSGDKIFIRQPVIEPQGEAKSALWIYKELGKRLGLGDFFQYTDEEDYLRQQLAPLGVSLEEIRLRGYVELPRRRRDEEIQVEHAQRQDRDLLRNAGKSRISTLCPPGKNRPSPKPGEFYLLTGKVGQHTQFGTQNNQLLHKYQDEPRLWMTPGGGRQRWD